MQVFGLSSRAPRSRRKTYPLPCRIGRPYAQHEHKRSRSIRGARRSQRSNRGYENDRVYDFNDARNSPKKPLTTFLLSGFMSVFLTV